MMSTVVNQPKTPHRTIRVADDPWKPAMARAVGEGRNLSEVIREFLTVYAAGGVMIATEHDPHFRSP